VLPVPSPDVNLEAMARVMPLMPFIAEPEEIATAIAYLASDDARFVTGTTFVIDGEQTAV
jgi:meso-butanediol dehydrogenase/(S,S)-butanediol dehydrogenase/diacetyl reductase